MSGEESGVCVVGAGGHAKVVIATLLAAGARIRGAYDDRKSLWGQRILGVEVLGSLDSLDREASPAGVLAIGSNSLRRDLAERFAAARWLTAIHPAAFVDPSAEVGAGTVVFAGAVVQAGARLGRHCIVNTGATLDHDCELGDFSHLAPGSHVAGDARLGEGSLVGTGAAVIPGVRIGAWTTVGAGAVVVGDLPDGVTAVGVPARARSDGRSR